MTAQLDGPRVPPASGGAAKQLVIFVHGYGADGNDLIGLSGEFSRYLPDAAFISPHAPEALQGGYLGGRQWFGLRTHSDEELWQGVSGARPSLEAFIVQEAARARLNLLSSVALVGFSQGTMMSLHVGFRLPQAPAAIVGFSGYLAGADKLAREITVKPPVLLIHGAEDPVIPVQAIHIARNALAAAGVPVQWQIRPGLAHGIDPQGLAAAGQFLRTAFGLG